MQKEINAVEPLTFSATKPVSLGLPLGERSNTCMIWLKIWPRPDVWSRAIRPGVHPDHLTEAIRQAEHSSGTRFSSDQTQLFKTTSVGGRGLPLGYCVLWLKVSRCGGDDRGRRGHGASAPGAGMATPPTKMEALALLEETVKSSIQFGCQHHYRRRRFLPQ